MTSPHDFGSTSLSPAGFAAKQATRQRTLDLIRRSDCCTEGGQLIGDWVELCGERDETLSMLLAQGVLRPGLGRYVGINSDPGVVAINREHYREATGAGLAAWEEGLWEDLASDLDRFPEARVVVFDGFNAVGARMDRALRYSQDLVEHLYRRNGTVLLVLNCVQRGTTRAEGRAHVERLRAWRERLCPGSATGFESRTYASRRAPMLIAWVPLGF